MKFHCFYQTAENINRDEWIDARDRDDAYALLKARGIRPYRVVGRNPRRLPVWTVLLAIPALLGISFAAIRLSTPRRDFERLPLPRSQVYGDTEILQRCEMAGWTNVFPNAGDAWLARHARPGIACDCTAGRPPPSPSPDIPVSFLSGEPEEYVKMKRIVNGMKDELAAYLSAGGSVNDYRILCDERLRTEEGIVQRVSEEFDRLRAESEKMSRAAFVAEWEKKNRALRALGLPTVLLPADDLN